MEKKDFLKIYLDPRISLTNVLKELKLSKSSLYRKVEQWNIPTYRVGIFPADNLPPSSPVYWKKFERGDLPAGVAHHLELAVELAFTMECRLETRFHPFSAIRRKIHAGELDFGLCDMATLPGWNEEFIFSRPYLFKSLPKGVVCRKRNRPILTDRKPILGVVRTSLHQHMAKKLWSEKYRIMPFAYHAELIRALKEEKVDLIMDHPSVFDFEKDGMEYIEGPIDYGGRTAIPLAPHNGELLRQIDQGLEALENRGVLHDLESRYLGDDVYFIDKE
ncbi:MAG: transporter substrate-binding domain-containing protein [Pseudomonadota bacterium]